MYHHLRSFGLLAVIGTFGPGVALPLEPLAYNHPGLAVDLGVGLWAWPLPCDADGDGDFDLVVSCPDKPSNGVYLFENATGDTARNAFPVFKPGRRIGPAAAYVMPSYAGGRMRVLTPGREHPDFLKTGIGGGVALPLAGNFHTPSGPQRKGPRLRHNQWRSVDHDGDADLDLVVAVEDWSHYGWDDAWNERGEWTNGPLHGWIYLVRNTGTAEQPVYAEPTLLEAGGRRLEVFGCPSPNFEDFDGDGDLDLLCGEFLDSFTYFENIGTRSEPRYSAGRRVKDAAGNPVSMELQMIVPVAFDWDRDGDADLVVGDEDGRVALVRNEGFLASDKTPVFAQPRYFQQEADRLKCGALATPVGFDWDGDGDQDIVSGNTAGFIEWFENLSGPGVAAPKWAAPRRLEAGGKVFRIMAGNRSIQGPAEAKWGYTTLSIADWDVDGLPDIVLNSITGDVQWLRNVGTRRAPKLAAPQPVEVAWDGPPPVLAWGWLKPSGKALLTQWRTTPVVHDFDGDGLPDLAILDTEGYLAFFRRAKRDGGLVLEPPRRAFVDDEDRPLRLTARTAGGSGRRKLCVTDWDGDGRVDLLLNSVNADLLRQVEARNGTWVMRKTGPLATKNIEGHDVSPATVDFDGDGVPDFLGGAEDGRLYFLANPRSAARPATDSSASPQPAGSPTSQAEPCRIEVVEKGTRWPVPLVELETVHGVKFVSDNAGLIAFDLPEAMGRETWCGLRGFGYGVPKDGFGNEGVRITPRPGGRLTLEVDRRIVAKRLGRITGAGLFAESQKLGEHADWQEQGVVGCDSVQNAVIGGNLFWLWGDTSLARYPLGIFDGTAARTALRPLDRLEPPLRIRFEYFRDPTGAPRPIARMSGSGPTWVTGVASVRDAAGAIRLVGTFTKIKPPLDAYKAGLCVWDAAAERFSELEVIWERSDTVPRQPPLLDGHAVDWTDPDGKTWLLFGNPFPDIRCPATFEAWSDPTTWEIVRAPTSLETAAGTTVVPHSGSIAWNAGRRRWVAIFMERFGKPSAFGELWYAEAASPLGPWGAAVKVVSHDNYTFYNPRIHPELTGPDSSVLLFEATFTKQFADQPAPVARYDYNQVLYRLDLDDAALQAARAAKAR